MVFLIARGGDRTICVHASLGARIREPRASCACTAVVRGSARAQDKANGADKAN